MTPDLVTKIQSDELTRERCGYGHRGRRSRRTWFLEINLHDYLAESADWNAESWDLPEPFRSAWIGDETAEREIGRAELLAVVESDAIGTHTSTLCSERIRSASRGSR